MKHLLFPLLVALTMMASGCGSRSGSGQSATKETETTKDIDQLMLDVNMSLSEHPQTLLTFYGPVREGNDVVLKFGYNDVFFSFDDFDPNTSENVQLYMDVLNATPEYEELKAVVGNLGGKIICRYRGEVEGGLKEVVIYP